MSRIVKVQDLSYKLSVSSGGTITLDTGVQVGSVIVTGDLTVLGNTTTVDTANMTIEDNIILLNKGETSTTGITERTAGIRIQRGPASPTNPNGGGISILFPDAQVIFDETARWRDSQIGTDRDGAFVLKTTDGKLIGLQTNSISTNGFDLNLIGTGTAVVTVTGTANYERQVIDYDAPGYPAIDDDVIPNIKAVIDYVTEYFNINPPYKIQDSKSVGGVTQVYDSKLEISDSEADGGSSNLNLILDGALNAVWYNDRHDVQDIRISGTRIETTASNIDLELASPGTGSVRIDDNLKLSAVTLDPAVALDSIKIYAKTEAYGGSGVFFVNKENTRDELVSRRKALAYSMIF